MIQILTNIMSLDVVRVKSNTHVAQYHTLYTHRHTKGRKVHVNLIEN